MSHARSELLEGLGRVGEASGHPFLQNLPLTLENRTANDRARLLRKGLMVVAFATVERFVRERIAEVMSSVSTTLVKFDDLPSELRSAATLGVLGAARLQSSFARARDEPWIAILQDASAAVASTAGGSLLIHRYAFAHAQSNVSADDVKSTLSAFNVKDPWGQITDIADRAGIGALPLLEAYVQAHRLRNSAAHDPTSSVEPTDLTDFLRQGVGICLGFDLALSRAAYLVQSGDKEHVRAPKKAISAGITLRFIDEGPRGFSEKRVGTQRAIKVSAHLADAIPLALSRARPSLEAVIVRDSQKTPRNWFTTDIE